jgi:hypothetical protein
VVSITAGGRHSMVLALPDNGDPDGRMLSRRASALVRLPDSRGSVAPDGPGLAVLLRPPSDTWHLDRLVRGSCRMRFAGLPAA